MARLRHKPSAANVGYKPIQVSRASIDRMREESNRVIANMRLQQQAEYEQRQKVLQSMKEDAAYAERQNLLNFNIQKEAREAQQLQQQIAAKNTQARIASEEKFLTQTFEGLGKFSQSLANVFEERQKRERENGEYVALVNSALGIEGEQTALVRFTENQLNQRGEVFALQADIEEAQGGDPVAMSKLRNSNPAVNYKIEKYSANQVLGNQMPIDVENWIIQNQDTKIEYKGKQVAVRAVNDDPDFASALYTALYKQYIVEKNIPINEPEFAKEGFLRATQFKASKIAAARKRSIEFNNASTLSKQDVLLADAAGTPEFTQQAQEWVRTYASVKGIEPTLAAISKLAIAVNADGEFIYTPEEIASIEFGDSKFGDRKMRFGEAMLNRQKMEIQRYNLLDKQDAIERNTYIEKINGVVFELFKEGGLTKANLQEAQQKIAENLGPQYIPSWYKKMEEQYTNEAIGKRETLETYNKYANLGLLNQEMVNAALELDARAGAALQNKLNQYNAVYKSDTYKKAVKSLTGLAGKQLGFLDPADRSGASFFLSSKLEEELKYQIQAARAANPNVDLNTLIPEIALKIQSEVDVNDSKNKYYKGDLKSAADAPTFPNLTTGKISTIRQGIRRIENFNSLAKRSGGGSAGFNKALITPGAVLTEDESTYVLENFGKPGFKFPAIIDYIVGNTGGKMDPFVVVNKALKANGKEELKIPDLVQNVHKEIDPRFREIIFSPTTGRNAKMRALRQAPDAVNSFRNASTMRKGSPVLAYISGNIGPTSTGPHLDVKQVGGGEFKVDALDEYVEVQDPELGRVPLSRVPITGDFGSHVARGSHGIDYGLYSGTEIYVKNGARVVNKRPSVHGDVVTIALPNGIQYTFLHGKAAK